MAPITKFAIHAWSNSRRHDTPALTTQKKRGAVPMALTKFSKSSKGRLRTAMNDILREQLRNNKIYMSLWFKILIGVSKIICATVLMTLYAWHMDWNQKVVMVSVFVVISFLTYLAQYGVSWFWWPRYYGTFYRDESDQRFVICADSPGFSGEYKIEIFQTKSMSFFQKLGKPVVDETFPFEKFFTESGYFVVSDWRKECDRMIAVALKPKSD